MSHYQEAVEELHSIIDWVRFSASEFERHGLFYGHGTDNPWDEAIALVTFCLNMPPQITNEQAQCRLITDEKLTIAKLLHRRISERKPLSYLTNQAFFAGMPFYVDERVLVPRSPLAEMIENRFAPWNQIEEPQRILDLCCGSGCIGIASLQAFPDAQLDLADLSRDALDVAEINIDQHGLWQQVAAIQSDLFDDLQSGYDLILSNPPYVDEEDLSSMPDEYHHEPAMGLGSGVDGLDITRKILAKAAGCLNDGGLLVVEVGNSCVHLDEAFPGVAFNWVEFERGGHGVFVMTKEELQQNHAHFCV